MRLLWLTMPAVVVALTQSVLAEALRPAPQLAAPAPVTRPMDALAPLDLAPVMRVLGFSPEPASPPTTRPSVRVLGTLEGPHALATIETPEARRAVTVGLGSTVGGWTVTAIDHGRIVLALRDERLELGGATTASSASPASPVLEVVGNRRRLSRAELERASVELAPQLARTTHIVPKFSDRAGGLVGFALSFPRDSPLRQLGLEPNDVVRTINGQPVTMQLALDLASRWTSLRHLELGLERAGQPTTLVLDAD